VLEGAAAVAPRRRLAVLRCAFMLDIVRSLATRYRNVDESVIDIAMSRNQYEPYIVGVISSCSHKRLSCRLPSACPHQLTRTVAVEHVGHQARQGSYKMRKCESAKVNMYKMRKFGAKDFAFYTSAS